MGIMWEHLCATKASIVIHGKNLFCSEPLPDPLTGFKDLPVHLTSSEGLPGSLTGSGSLTVLMIGDPSHIFQDQPALQDS